MAGTLPEMGMQTLGEMLVEEEAKVIVNTLFETRQETLTQVNSDALFDRLGKRISK